MEQINELLNQEFPVLDKGYIKLLGVLGSDEHIVQSARISYKGEPQKRDDAGLIDYLMRNEQSSPFEQMVFSFKIKAPIFIAREWMRHRTARINEVSGCYSILQKEFYIPSEENMRFYEPADSELKQEVIKEFKENQQQCYESYKKVLDCKVVKELSRITLPVSMYTEWFWQIDLHNLFRFIKLRFALVECKEVREDSPVEMRLYAKLLLEIIEKLAPMSVSSFKNHILQGKRFSRDELKAIMDTIDINSLEMEDEKALERLKDKLSFAIEIKI